MSSFLSLYGANERVFGESFAAQRGGDPAAPQDDDTGAKSEHVAGVRGGQHDGQAAARIRPRTQAVPGPVQVVDLVLGETSNGKLLEQTIEDHAVQIVDLHPRQVARAQGARDSRPSQALLLVGWLASCLGWRPLETLAPSEAGGLLFAIARPDGARIMVRVRPRFEPGLEDGDIRGIRIQATDGRQEAEFVVRREPSPRHQTATVFLDGERRW